jgi:hypothetical protein
MGRPTKIVTQAKLIRSEHNTLEEAIHLCERLKNMTMKTSQIDFWNNVILEMKKIESYES